MFELARTQPDTLLWWFTEVPRFQYALVVCIAVGTLCSLLSVVVVLKRMAFIGQGISHAGFGGVGTALFFGLASTSVAQDFVVLGFCLFTALLIGALTRRRQIEPDSAIGILLVAAMAFGVLIDELGRLLHQARVGWYVDLVGPQVQRAGFESLLFGSLLSVTEPRMWLAVGLSAAVLLVCAAMFKELLFFSFDETVCRVYGVPARLMHYLLLLLLAVTVVVCIRLAGVILVSALLVIPAATALQMSRRLGPVFLCSWVVGMIGLLGGLVLAVKLEEFSTGPCIVAVLCGLFALGYGYGWLRRRWRRGAASG